MPPREAPWRLDRSWLRLVDTVRRRPRAGGFGGAAVFMICGGIAVAPSAVGAPIEMSAPGEAPLAPPVARDPGPTDPPEPSHPPGDAEPAPAPASAPSPTGSALATGDSARAGARHRIAVMPRYSYRLSSSGRAVTPSSGFGIGGTVETTYLRIAAGLEAAWGVDFSHDRFSSSEVGTVSVDNNQTATFRAPRVTSETSFVLVHTVAARAGRLRPYLTVGAGLGLGYFDSAALELQPGSARDAHALGRLALGVDVTVARDWCASMRAEYTAVRGVGVWTTDAGERLALFGDLFGIGAGIAYRF